MELVEIGIVGKPSGLKGEVNVFLDIDLGQPFPEGEVVFLVQAGAEVPYVVSSMEHINRNKWKIKFIGFDDVNAAEKLKNLPLLASEDKVVEQGGSDGPEALSGYKVENAQGFVIGIVEAVFTNTPQPVLQIRLEGGQEVLLPAVDEFIVLANHQGRVIRIDPPEGLFDLYM